MSTSAEKYGLILKYLNSNSIKIQISPDLSLRTLSQTEFEDLLCDFSDELDRRLQNNAMVPFLPIILHFHQLRNQGRQKLAKVSINSFNDLLVLVAGEYQRRYEGDEPRKLSLTEKYLNEIKNLTAELEAARLENDLLNAQLELQQQREIQLQERCKLYSIKCENLELENKFLRGDSQGKEEGLRLLELLTAAEESLDCQQQKNKLLEEQIRNLKTKVNSPETPYSRFSTASLLSEIYSTNCSGESDSDEITFSSPNKPSISKEIKNISVLPLAEKASLDKFTPERIVTNIVPPLDPNKLALDCREFASKIGLFAAEKRTPKVSLIKEFFMCCKRVSDECDRMENLGLFTATEMQQLSKAELVLDESLRSLLTISRQRVPKSDHDLQAMERNIKHILDTIEQMVMLINETKTVSGSYINDAKIDRFEGKASEEEPFELGFLVLFQQHQANKIIKLFREILVSGNVTEVDFQKAIEKAKLLIHSIVNETSSTLDVQDAISEAVYDDIQGLLSHLGKVAELMAGLDLYQPESHEKVTLSITKGIKELVEKTIAVVDNE